MVKGRYMSLVRFPSSNCRLFGCYLHQKTRRMTSKSPQEVCLPVPWGHIAGLAWGHPKGIPVLALHGWLDNAGSFNRLIPLLSEDFYVVAVDWPGHGRSSARPPGVLYNSYDYISDIKYIIDGLKWDKFSILAHSMGGGAASWFAGALPENMECLILLESLGFWSVSMNDLPTLMGGALKNMSSLEKVENKSYSSWDTILDRIVDGHKGVDKLFDRECASILAERGTCKMKDGSYKLTRDIRLKALSILRIPEEINLTFLNSIQCPVLIIIAEESNSASVISTRKSKLHHKIKLVEVPGGHHVHLYQPLVLCNLVNSFLLTQTLPQVKEISKI